MKFDLDLFEREKIAVNCQTEDESKAYQEYLHDLGLEWNDGKSLTEFTIWSVFGENTCYSIWVGDTKRYVTFGSKSYCFRLGEKVIPYSELVFDEGGEAKSQKTKGENEKSTLKEKYVGEYVIVWCKRSGLYSGILNERDGTEVELTDCRYLKAWSGSFTIMEMSTDGVLNPSYCKFTKPIVRLLLLDAVEILPCTEKAEQSIRGVPIWEY